jgi:L-fuculose-phosphate aldolase
MMCTNYIAPGHDKSETEHRQDICTAGNWLYERGFIPACDGNLSIRLNADRILATPKGFCKGMMTPEDLVTTDMAGRRLHGSYEPSSELAMHLLIYSRRPDANAICHAHPPIATGFAAAGVALDKPLLAEMVVTFGRIPLAPFALPGTSQVPWSLEPLVGEYDAILMANHGVVTFGVDLISAFHRMDVVEHYARVSLVTEILGKQSLLSGCDVEKLLTTRQRPAKSKETSVTVGQSAS